ncbi:MAG: Rpn family recombination-promoting nuclease/putative transposase, partial [Myxococcota bacterium]
MPTNMPHDALFRQMMRFSSFQQAFAQRHVPQQIQHVVDLKQLQQVPAHFCQAHKSVIPDCVLSAPFKQGPGRFYLVTEQETNPRPAV